jgi:murein DD-endopeptidase MepM/ murein hydrolase activator NlpD
MLGVILLRPPAVSRGGDLPFVEAVRGRTVPSRDDSAHAVAVGVSPSVQRRRPLPSRRNYFRAGLALPLLLAQVTSLISAWPETAAAVQVGARSLVTARLVPHVLVLGLAAAAVWMRGFSPPEVGFSVAMATEEGSLSEQGRHLLGPRAAEIQVRDALIRPALSTTTLTPSRPRAEALTYTVRPGDNAWDIGARFNVGAYSVLWSNGLDQDDIIRPGQVLRIPPVVGAVHAVSPGDTLDSIAGRFSVDPGVIVDFNSLLPGEGLQPDKLLIIPGGSLPILPPAPVIRAPAAPPVQPAAPAPAPAPRVSAPQTQTQPQTRPAPAPAPRQTVPVPAPPIPAPTGRLSWPTRGLITTYFSGWHPGIDVAAPIGTAIGAADGGTVTFTGWNSWGYGYRIVVDHGNGISTTYNHLSAILVRPGQVVGKGQQIARMGSTGRSSGSHLHFEVLRNGGFVNPIAVLG